jgi:aldose 1-epimerase
MGRCTVTSVNAPLVIELNANGALARLVPHAGGRVSALRLVTPGGKAADVLYPYPEQPEALFDPIVWAKGGIYPLMPYSNRIAHATVQVNGEAVALAPHPNAVPHTLHGNAHAQPWRVQQADAASATLVLASPASPAWPWHYTASMRFELSASALQVQLTLHNADSRTMPAGFGLHPYFVHSPEALLSYAATSLWPATAEYLPGRERPQRVDECYVPARRLPNGTLTDYVGGWDGTASVDVAPGARLTIHADPVFGHLVVHRPDTPIYLCLEPVSHVADGFNLAARGVANTGTHLLAPGESLTGGMRFALID